MIKFQIKKVDRVGIMDIKFLNANQSFNNLIETITNHTFDIRVTTMNDSKVRYKMIANNSFTQTITL